MAFVHSFLYPSCYRCGSSLVGGVSTPNLGSGNPNPEESYIILPEVQPYLSDSYFALPPPTRAVGDRPTFQDVEYSMMNSVASVSHTGLGESIQRLSRLEILSKLPIPESHAVQSGDPGLCSHCCDGLMDLIRAETNALDRSIAAYRDFIDQTATDGQASNGHHSSYDVEEGSALASNLEVSALELQKLRQENVSIAAQELFLGEQEQQTWELLLAGQYAREHFQRQCIDLLQTTQDVRMKADSLARTPVLEAAFHVQHLDGYPCVNSYRLARFPDDRKGLGWPELNAAWGQTVLLLQCIAHQVQGLAGVASCPYLAVPMNCSSKLVQAGPSSSSSQAGVKVHNLHHTGDKSIPDFDLAVASVLGFSTYLLSAIKEALPPGVKGPPYAQGASTVGGVEISALRTPSAWNAWLCQFVNQVQWMMRAAAMCL